MLPPSKSVIPGVQRELNQTRDLGFRVDLASRNDETQAFENSSSTYSQFTR